MRVTTRLEELRIDSLAFGGDGVARRADGQVVFVPRCAPGDRVLARIERQTGSYARAAGVRLLEAGPQRTRPECEFYESCGGCQLQHVIVEDQRRAKRSAVQEALRRIGRLDVEVPRVVSAGPAFGYRNRVSLTLRRDPEGGVTAGFHRPGAPRQVADVADCLVAEAPVRAAWRGLRSGWGRGASALPAGRELRVSLRASADGRIGVLVTGGDAAAGPGDIGRVVESVPGLHCYHWRPAGAPRVLLAGSERLPDRWLGLDFELGPETFVQANRAVATQMERLIDALVGELEGTRYLDLYSGIGARGLRWSSRGGTGVCCDRDAEAIRSGESAARAVGARLRLIAAPVEAALENLLPSEIIVVNPPRRGLSSPVRSRLSRGGGRCLVYVSCDPATLARDLRQLTSGWVLEGVQPFDAFPNSYHVETVAWLRGREPGAGAGRGRNSPRAAIGPEP